MHKKTVLDANAILRYIIDDIEEQANLVEEILRTKEVLVLPEVLAEVIYVMTKYYGFPRDKTSEYICEFLSDAGCASGFLDNTVKLFGSKNIDFVDCLLCEYSAEYDVFTFDEQLRKIMQKR